MDLTILSDDELLSLRDEYKKKKSIEHINQHARKILINALYGAMGNRFFRYYNLKNAEATTIGGQLSTRWAERKLNEYLNKLFKTDTDYIIYGDTDSVYLSLKILTDKFPNKTEDELTDIVDKFCETKLQPVINKGYVELADYVNAYDQKMFMDREVIATKAFFCSKKKRYAMFVKDNEGIRKDKLKIMGIETQKSTTPKAVAKALTQCIRLILTKDEITLQKYVDEFRKEFDSIDYRLLGEVKPANNLGKWGDANGNPISGSPGHIRTALSYNKISKEYKFDPIIEGEKFAQLPMVMPNKWLSKKMCYPAGGDLPKEISSYVIDRIDYGILWDKMFMNPLNSICNDIKFKSEDIFDLEDFM